MPWHGSVRRKAIIVAVAATMAFAAHAQESVRAAAQRPAGPHADVLRLIELWLDGQVDYNRVRGLSAGVVVGQDLVWSKGYGTIDAGRRVAATPATIYSICSISKLFTSVAVMQLWEEGKVSLDDDIARYLPAFSIQRSDADSGPITVRSLLSHSSGLPREADFPYWTSPDFRFPTRTELLQKLGTQRTLMRASDRYQYSNLAMSVLGEVVASVSGRPYALYVQERILEPLGLADTRTMMPIDLYGKRLAQGFGPLKRDGTRDLLKPFDAAGITPAAGYTSTVEDLARFASWQFRLLKNGGTEVLRVATLREMQRVQWTDADGKATWGLGFGVSRDGANTLVGHSGSCPGYLTGLSMVPKEEVAFIAMTNGNNGNSNGEIAEYTRPMRQLFLKGMKLATPKAGGPDLESYAGRYSYLPWVSERVIVPWGSQLAVLDLPNANPAGDLFLLQHVAGDTFRVVREDGTLAEDWVFERGADGLVVQARSRGQVQPLVSR